jgi:hypothetical protein
MDVESEAHEVFQRNLLRMIMADDNLADVSLHLGRHGSQTSVANCHRVILAAQSPVFAQLFQQALSGNAKVHRLLFNVFTIGRKDSVAARVIRRDLSLRS